MRLTCLQGDTEAGNPHTEAPLGTERKKKEDSLIISCGEGSETLHMHLLKCLSCDWGGG